VIGKICPRGQDVAGLIRYLYGPGRREEHTDPHIIAGYRPASDLEPPVRASGSRDFRRLTGLLQLPHDVLGKWGYARPVWHCSMRAAPQDRMLSDQEWTQIAEDVMDRTGLCPREEEDEAVRWIAIRHGPDHIHLVAMLARQDRTRPRIVNERYRVRDACLAAEQRYRLRSTAPADRTAARPPSRAETGKAARHGRGEPPRITLRRHVATAAASASSATEFFARLDQAGILVRLRYSVTNPGQVTGYAVALPEDSTRNGEPVWYGGGKLAADLSWPRLAQRWTRPARPEPPLTAAEADALWDYAARTTADATDRIRYCSATGNPVAAADAAYAASDTLHVAAAALGSRALRQAADSFERAARQPHGCIPAPTPAGNQLRHAARLIAAYAYLTGDRKFTPIVLLVRLAALAEAVAELRDSQQRAAQAASALRAAQHLRTATSRASPDTRPPGRPAVAIQPPAPKFAQPGPAGLAQLSFSTPPGTRPSVPGQSGPGDPPPARRPPPPRPRGPTR
jgi:HPt (histidine-containing phosphotransfer) domain-containing protein